MGSLTSRPKVPKQTSPQIVYVPAPQPTYTPAPAYTAPPAPTAVQPVTPSPTPDEEKAEARTQSLLTRDRSRFGTVTTSFRGLLGLASGNSGQSKTLLGE